MPPPHNLIVNTPKGQRIVTLCYPHILKFNIFFYFLFLCKIQYKYFTTFCFHLNQYFHVAVRCSITLIFFKLHFLQKAFKGVIILLRF